MNDIVKIVEEIIQNNVGDLPLNETVEKDKIRLDKNIKYYKTMTSINIPKHEVSFTRILKEHYKGKFLSEKKYDTSQSYFLKYKNEVIPLTESEFYYLDDIWYNQVHDKKEQKWNNDTMNIVINTTAG